MSNALDTYMNTLVPMVVETTNRGERAGYSEMCPELNLNAPSSGGTSAITTTTTGGDYSSSFGGTSAAAPVAAVGTGAVLFQSLNRALNMSMTRLCIASSTPISFKNRRKKMIDKKIRPYF